MKVIEQIEQMIAAGMDVTGLKCRCPKCGAVEHGTTEHCPHCGHEMEVADEVH